MAEAIKELDIPVDGFAIVDVLGLRDRLDARTAEALGDFDAAKLWDIDAATSLTAWLRAHGGLTLRSAGRLSLLARRLRQLPVTSAAYAEATRRADALVDIARFFLDFQRTHSGGRHRPHVNVVVNLEDLAGNRGWPGGRRSRPRCHEHVPAVL